MTQIVFLIVFQKVQSDMPMPMAMPLMEQMGFPASLLLMVLISLVLVNFDLNPDLDYQSFIQSTFYYCFAC